MLFLTIFTIFISLTFANKTVKYAAVIYRHGDRTPVNMYPNDPYRNQSLWPVKFGELTNTGKNQHYNLGKWLKRRYSSLVSEKFDPDEVYIRSTDVDRTLMSAQANLAGMYPPMGESVWNKDLMWQPIPVHTRPEKDDEVLAMKRKCNPYIKEKEKYQHSPDYKKRLHKYKNLMDYMSAYAGKKIKDYWDICDVYNALLIESIYNFTLPGWTQSIFPTKMREPACYSFVTLTGTPLMARLLVGPLLKEIVGKMNIVMQKKKPNPVKLSIYSGHDITVGNVLNALGLFDGNCPAYTSTIFLELMQDDSTKEYSIRLSYRNTPEIIEPHVLNIPQCGTDCPFEKFLKLYNNLLSVDWENECLKSVSPLLSIGSTLLILLMIMYVVHRVYLARMAANRRVQSSCASVYHLTSASEKAVDL